MSKQTNAVTGQTKTIYVSVTARVEIPAGVDLWKVMEGEGIASGGNLVFCWEGEESKKMTVTDLQLDGVGGISEEEWL